MKNSTELFQEALLRLFNGIQIAQDDIGYTLPKSTLERTIKNGYILDPAIQPNNSILISIESIIGISGEKANASFHKSWKTVKDTPIEILVLQQIVHYITTYGYEQLGIYDNDTIYIPNEELKLPDVELTIPIVVIKALDKTAILEKIISLSSGIALHQDTLNDIMIVIRYNKYNSDFVGRVKNRELKALLFDHYNIVPQDPVEFLRHIVSKLTNESLLIKNNYLITKIKESNGKFLDILLKDAPNDLASIFLRYKPLFLAMKSISNNKTYFNQLRKKANKLHKPLPEDYLANVTSYIKNNTLDKDVLVHKLNKASIFRKIRLLYALNYRYNNEDKNSSIVYRIRNGKGWATSFNYPYIGTFSARTLTMASIAKDIKKNVKDKTIYIPPNIHYALPATEKQFTGNLPTGSYVTVPQDMIVGIHWTDTSDRVDLDLSAMNDEGKIGWDGEYRNSEKSVLFSGDNTSAPKPNGASELFYFRGNTDPRIMMVNYYNFNKGDEVNTKIIVASEKPNSFNKDYMVDVNNIIASANININKKQNVLGLITSEKGENRFYFANISIGDSITSSNNTQSDHMRKYLINIATNPISFREILELAGANIINEQPENINNDYIDLSPEALDKNTIIDLVK